MYQTTAIDSAEFGAEPVSSIGDVARGVKSHRPGAEGALVSLLRDRLVSDVRRHGMESEAEDIAHEALLIAIARLRSGAIDDPDCIGGFVVGTVRKMIAARARQSIRRKTDVDSQVVDSQQSRNESLDEFIFGTEMRRKLRMLIAQLDSPRDSALLYRFYIRDEDMVSICADLNVTSRQLSRLLYRARQRLKKLIVADESQWLLTA